MPDEQPAPRKQLGWVQAPPDPRTLKLARYTTPQLPAPPTSVDWLSKVRRWPMLGNDRMGDCVVVSCAHHVQGWTANAAGVEVLIPETEVVKTYSAVSGYNPRTGANDRGCRSLDVLNRWRRIGIGGRKILAYVQLDHRNRTEMQVAAHLFGGLIIAAQLPQAADAQFDRRQPWTVTTGSNARRGSWGGHAMHCGKYDTNGLVVSTWGRTQRATWSWWDRYGAEAYAAVSIDWLDASGANPLGFDIDRLTADLADITTL